MCQRVRNCRKWPTFVQTTSAATAALRPGHGSRRARRRNGRQRISGASGAEKEPTPISVQTSPSFFSPAFTFAAVALAMPTSTRLRMTAATCRRRGMPGRSSSTLPRYSGNAWIVAVLFGILWISGAELVAEAVPLGGVRAAARPDLAGTPFVASSAAWSPAAPGAGRRPGNPVLDGCRGCGGDVLASGAGAPSGGPASPVVVSRWPEGDRPVLCMTRFAGRLDV